MKTLSPKRHSLAPSQNDSTLIIPKYDLTEDRLIEILPDAIAAIDQPTMDGINTFVVSRAVKDAGITVALSGLGGDELFAGYPSFQTRDQARVDVADVEASFTCSVRSRKDRIEWLGAAS